MESRNKSFGSWLKRQETEDELSFMEKARAEVNKMLQAPENVEPERGHLDDSDTKWRCGKPDYAVANLAFLMGKTQCHAKGSLEILVENAVKTWEMEASHKVDTSQWKTIIHEKYNVQANGGKVFTLKEASTRGNYNVLLDHVDANLYNAANQDFESSHHLFRNALEGNFPWEVIKVYAGPPDIVFSWRHWGEFTGQYEENKGHGQLLEMTGFAFVSVTDELKITDLRVFYKPEEFLKALKGQESTQKNRASQSTFSFSSWMNSLQHKARNFSFIQKVEEELNKTILMSEVKKPDRGHLNDFSVAWKSGSPNYTLVDLAYLKGKSYFHEKEGLELLVENLVKTCEMEISHKAKSQWKTLSSNECNIQVNGEDISKELESFTKASSDLSRKAFPWEVIEVYSKAPDFSFTWRHWIELDGIKEPTVKEIKGFSLIKLNKKGEIKNIKVYYTPSDIPNESLEGLGKCPFSNHSKTKV